MNNSLRAFFLASALLICFIATAQNSININGYVRDSLSRETLIGATITVQGQVKSVKSNA
jgi:hypothetical protein